MDDERGLERVTLSWTRGFLGAQVPWSYDAGIPRKIPMSMNLDSIYKAAGRPQRI